jgi:DNA-binding transcriptional regulator YiaG
MAKKPGRILISIHKTVVGLHKAGVIDEATMRQFDALCLAPSSASREKESLSVGHIPGHAKRDPGSSSDC